MFIDKFIFWTIFCLFIGFLMIVGFKIESYFDNKKKKLQTKIEEVKYDVPKGIITPLEALKLNDYEISYLKKEIDNINNKLKMTTNGYDKIITYTLYENEDYFSIKSAYEIEKLYTRAGWVVKAKRTTQYISEYSWSKRHIWKITFKLPSSISISDQLSKTEIVNLYPETDQ